MQNCAKDRFMASHL